MKTVSIVVSIFVVGFISSCGGGGGGYSPSTTNPASTYSISGTVTGAASVAVSLTGAAAATTTTVAGGNYSFTGLANGSYTVKPAKAGYVFSPVSLAVSMSGANVAGKNFTATASTAVTYTISGTVTGAVVQGVTITLNGANTGSTVTDANGNYSFSGLVSGNYTVTPTLAGYSFTTSSTIVIVSVNPPSNNFTSTVTPSGSKVVFVPLNPLPPAMVGAAYSNTVISTPTSGGTAPYHYQSDSFATGAPPMGMIVDLNGNLTGKPKVAGTYTFGVCAVDLVGAQSCKTTSIVVNPASVTGTWSGTLNMPGAGYPGCLAQAVPLTLTLTEDINMNITGSTDNGRTITSGTRIGNTITVTLSTYWGSRGPYNWTWNGTNTITGSMAYFCYDLATLNILSEGTETFTVTRP